MMSQSLHGIVVAKMVHVLSECVDTLHVLFGSYHMEGITLSPFLVSETGHLLLKMLPEKLTFLTVMRMMVSQEIMTKKNDSLLTCTTFLLVRNFDYNSKRHFQLSYEYVFIEVFNHSSVNFSYDEMFDFCL